MALMIGLRGSALSTAETAQLADPAVGGVILFTRNHADGPRCRRCRKWPRAGIVRPPPP